MAWSVAGILLLFTASYMVEAAAPPEKCERTYSKVGCYHDRIIPDRPYPFELVNHRDPINKNWDGHLISWKKTEWPQSLHALACKCAELTRERGHVYFGLQFFGECWSGPSHQFYRDGPSDKCVGIDYKPCDDRSETECVGKAFTNYIYMLDEDKKIDEKIPGGWNEWSPWSPCSAKCNGGERFRERQCNNPLPQNGGAACEGEGEEAQECNTEPCEPVCKMKLEIGIILDASTSVTRKNWDRTLDFVKALSKEFVVSPTGVHFGVISYAWEANLEFNISDSHFWNPIHLDEKVSSIHYSYGGTRTDLALKMAEESFFCKTCGLRAGVPKILIVLTDGKSSITSVPMPEATANLKKKRVNIMAIGVGKKFDEEELHEIATNEKYVFKMDGYVYLKEKINKIMKAACHARLF